MFLTSQPRDSGVNELQDAIGDFTNSQQPSENNKFILMFIGLCIAVYAAVTRMNKQKDNIKEYVNFAK